MPERKPFFFVMALMMLFLMPGCSTEPGNPNPRSGKAEILQIDTRTAKIFFYVVYDSPDAKPFFPETFRLHIDGSYVGDINPDQFLTQRLTPGSHSISADELDWGGFDANNNTTKIQVSGNTTYYVTEHLRNDSKPLIVNTEPSQGSKDIADRSAARQ